MRRVDVGSEFYPRLANRDERQDDGSNNAIMFRKRFLQDLDDNPILWNDDVCYIELDFSSVDILGPSFANEAFAYFTRLYKPEKILKKIHFTRISRVKLLTIEKELKDGYSR